MSTDAFDGLMLSDGSLGIARGSINAKYQQTCREASFLIWAAERLLTSSKVTGPHSSGGGKYQYWMLRTGNDEAYTSQFRRWHRDGKKIIPRDFVVSRESMLSAYLGDGGMSHPSTGRSFITLATYCFSLDDVEFLMDGLLGHGIESKLRKRKLGGWSIHIVKENVEKFLDFIGPCPGDLKEEYGYKWATKEKILIGGSRPGARNGNAKLSRRDASEIRALYASGVKQKDIASKFEVHQTNVSRIVRGAGWIQ